MLPYGFRLGLPDGLTWVRGKGGWWHITDTPEGAEHRRSLGGVTDEALSDVWDAEYVVRCMVERAVGSLGR